MNGLLDQAFRTLTMDFIPRVPEFKMNMHSRLHIMWTHLGSVEEMHLWSPNHLVPLLQNSTTDRYPTVVSYESSAKELQETSCLLHTTKNSPNMSSINPPSLPNDSLPSVRLPYGTSTPLNHQQQDSSDEEFKIPPLKPRLKPGFQSMKKFPRTSRVI